MAKKRPTKKRATKKSRSKGKRRTQKQFGPKPGKKRLAELEGQFNQLMALTQGSQVPLIRENARVLAERIAQFKAGEIKAEQVKATINIQRETIQALAAAPPPPTPTPGGDRTPTLHETDVALKLLQIGLKLLL